MTIYSLFLSDSIAAYTDDVDSPEYAETVARFLLAQRYNILYRRLEEIAIDNGQTKTFSFANFSLVYPNDWVFLLAEVTGSVRFDTAGKDYDNVTTINGRIPCQGTTMYPGKVQISTYNLTTLQLVGLQDGSVVRMMGAIACDDSDARYTENA